MFKLINNYRTYFAIKKYFSQLTLSKETIEKKIQNIPNWLNEQIEENFKYFVNKKNDIDGTIENFKKFGLLKSALLIKIKIKNNKISYKNFLPFKYHPRIASLNFFLKNILKIIKFPNVEFLYSIHDYFEYVDKWQDCLKCPVFCISKLKDKNKVILFPHIEAIRTNENLMNSSFETFPGIEWNKKINKIFWRGTNTGFDDLNKNERYKIVKFATQNPEFFDVGFSNFVFTGKNPKKNEFYIKKDNCLPKDQLKYKYLLAIDGNAFPGSFFWQLFSNSLILRNKSNYLEWYYKGLKNNEHYIEYSCEKDLLEKLMFLKQNDKLTKNVIKNANNFAKEYLINEAIIAYIFKLLEKLSLFNFYGREKKIQGF